MLPESPPDPGRVVVRQAAVVVTLRVRTRRYDKDSTLVSSLPQIDRISLGFEMLNGQEIRYEERE